MKKVAVVAAWLLLAIPVVSSPVVAQDSSPQSGEGPAIQSPDARAVPTLSPRHPRKPFYLRGLPLDIPQWAKDAGHNGAAIYIATVSADGTLTALELKRSSMSEAIDQAVRDRVEKLRFGAGTNAAGERAEGTVEIRMSYARYDSDSPGGGLVNYTCADFIREHDWFKTANPSGRPIFWLENAYTSLSSVGRVLNGERLEASEMRATRHEREKKWAGLIKACRKKPTTLFLDHVDQPEEYRILVESF